ncbi:MAG: UvrB/UvrC motif-containing protein [Acidobacteriota bacterium]|nr:UvrB/UvrC motif-containing protein [Acidobacteriota bacterium]
MPSEFQSLPFDPADPKAALAQLPQTSAVFALYGAEARFEPYVGRTPNLRGRLERLLQPSANHPRRLQLAGRVRRIAWRPTGSEFASLLLQFELLQKIYGTKCLERMHLRHPAFVRFLGGNPYPRLTVTYRLSQREAAWAYGPFPSRAAAERYAEEVLKLFLLRRCTFDLDPDPSYPGCVYSEMKMCLAPCYQGCTYERYAEEAAAVQNFLASRGESRLVTLRTERDQASANLEFEKAAAIHAQVARVESVRALAAELVRPLNQLRAVILQASSNPGEIAVFLFENGRLRGPAAFSILGMRIQNEQSGSSSLFAQPLAIEPVPESAEIGGQRSEIEVQGTEIRDHELGISRDALENASEGRGVYPHQSTPESAGVFQPSENHGLVSGHDFSRAANVPESTGALAPEESTAPPKISRGLLEARFEAVLAQLVEPRTAPSPSLRQGHLALLKRWYYRPEARRTGEIFFPGGDGRWPVKAILRGVGRVAAGSFRPSPSAT